MPGPGRCAFARTSGSDHFSSSSSSRPSISTLFVLHRLSQERQSPEGPSESQPEDVVVTPHSLIGSSGGIASRSLTSSGSR